MKEITRIHIAKVSYDIETAAKKELEKYINKLELYADDAELLQDIEIRITELLAERGVTKDSVITSDDVKAVRVQLGEPQDFMGDGGDIAVGVVKELDGDTTRKLYRDKDSAILGGVLSGVARFFRIDPIWTRLIFVILLFVSFGTAALVYVIAWIAIPAARTAAEKLRMSGQSVTLGSIRELNEQDEQLAGEYRTASIVRRALQLGVGTISALAAVGALFVTIGGAFGLLLGTGANAPIVEYIPHSSWVLWLAYGLLVFAGILLTSLFTVFSFAAFRRTYSKRMTVATIAILILGVVSAGLAGSLVAYHGWQASEQIQRDTKTKTVSLSSSFGAVKQLKVNSGSNAIGWGDYSDARVEYIVDDTPRYELTALPGTAPKITVDGDVAALTIERAEGNRMHYSSPTLKIYGPALEKMAVESGSVSYSTTKPQANLTVESQEANGNVELYGSYEKVDVAGGTINLDGSSVEVLDVRIGVQGRIEAGTVRSLAVAQPDVCPSLSERYENVSRVVVRAVTSGEMTYNGQAISAKTHETPCGVVVIGQEDEYDERYDN